MADKVTTSNILGIGLEYTDTEKDTKKITYIKVPNPKTVLTEEQVKSAVQKLITGEQPILKDAQGNAFNTETAVVTAYRENTETVEYDIGIE